MPLIKSRFLGEVEVNDDMLFHFRGPILGFEEYENFYLIENDENKIFRVLQSATDEDVSFVLIEPFMFFSNYILDVAEEDMALIEMKEKDDLLALVIITVVDGDFKNMTANLLGPIIFNIRNHKAIQCILKTDKYTTKHRVLPEEATVEN